MGAAMNAPRLPRRVAALLVAVLATLEASCGAPRTTLNTSASPCFRGLGLAISAVGDRGNLVGVRRLSATSLAARIPGTPDLGKGRVCVVAFRGDFADAKDFTHTEDGEAARYAVVVLDDRGSAMRSRLVTSRLPFRFRHRM